MASNDEIASLFTQVRESLNDSQAAVDALSAFFRERATLEDNYSKALARLSKNALNVSGA